MKKQKDGRYRAKIAVGENADGSTRYKYLSARTRKELEDKKRRALADYRDGISEEDGRGMSASEWVMRYYLSVLAVRQKPTTRRDIESQIRRYILPYLQDKRLRAVTYLDIQMIVAGLEGVGRTLTVNMLSVLRNAFAGAVAQGLISRDPTAAVRVRLPQREHNRALTDEERKTVERLIAERKAEPLLLGLLYYTGMRRGEVIGLQWRDIDFKADVIHVRRDYDYKVLALDTLKTPNAVRDIPLIPQLRELLLERPGIGETFVISSPRDAGKPLCEATYKRRFDKIRAELAPDVTARTFRDNFATVLYDAGVDLLTASKAMGHADPSTTAKIYIDIERSKKVAGGAERVRSAFDCKGKVAGRLPDGDK